VSFQEIIVIVLGLAGGYWGVSALLDRRRREQPKRLSEPVSPERTPDWAAILGVTATASLEEIQRAYRSRIAEYHPDKVATLGAELRDLAERKSKEINLAYERACRARGEQA